MHEIEAGEPTTTAAASRLRLITLRVLSPRRAEAEMIAGPRLQNADVMKSSHVRAEFKD